MSRARRAFRRLRDLIDRELHRKPGHLEVLLWITAVAIASFWWPLPTLWLKIGMTTIVLLLLLPEFLELHLEHLRAKITALEQEREA